MQAYRLLTEEDTAAFCHKVTAAFAEGWVLYGSPSYAFDPATQTMRCAQAVTKEVAGPYDPAMKLSEV